MKNQIETIDKHFTDLDTFLEFAKDAGKTVEVFAGEYHIYARKGFRCLIGYFNTKPSKGPLGGWIYFVKVL